VVPNCGLAWLMTLPTALIVPLTPKFSPPRASSPRPLETPATVPALK